MASGRKESFFDMNTEKSLRTAALSISVFLALVTAACLLYLFLIPLTYDGCIAEIYQDGRLIRSIPLAQVQESYTIEINDINGCTNRIEVHTGGIGVIWADCPDQLCVRQGFSETPAIPIVCLPNRLVVCLRPVNGDEGAFVTPDAITY